MLLRTLVNVHRVGLELWLNFVGLRLCDFHLPSTITMHHTVVVAIP